MANVIRQQNDNRFLIEAKPVDGVEMGRIYDLLLDTYSDPMPVGSITAHSFGWGPPTASQAVLDLVEQRVSGRY